MNESDVKPEDSCWEWLFRMGSISALLIVALTAAQIIIFSLHPPPSTVNDFFMLFQQKPLLGLLNYDLLYIPTNVLMGLLYLALYPALRRANPSFMAIALICGLVGIAAYFVSNTSFEMLSLSGQYAAAVNDTQRTIFLAAGQTLFAIYKGTAFDVYYVLNAIALLILSVVMLRSNIFSKVIARLGILTALLMIVPSTAGMLGLLFAFLSLVPFSIWSILIARRLFHLGQSFAKEEARELKPAPDTCQLCLKSPEENSQCQK